LCRADALHLRSPGRLTGVGVPVLRTPLLGPAVAPDDPDRLPVHQGVGDLPPRLMEVAPEGLSGDAEGDGGLFLIESLEVDEPQGLHLLGEDDDELVGPPAEGAETTKHSLIPDSPADPGPAPPAVAVPLAGLSLVHGIISGEELRPTCR